MQQVANLVLKRTDLFPNARPISPVVPACRPASKKSCFSLVYAPANVPWIRNAMKNIATSSNLNFETDFHGLGNVTGFDSWKNDTAELINFFIANQNVTQVGIIFFGPYVNEFARGEYISNELGYWLYYNQSLMHPLESSILAIEQQISNELLKRNASLSYLLPNNMTLAQLQRSRAITFGLENPVVESLYTIAQSEPLPPLEMNLNNDNLSKMDPNRVHRSTFERAKEFHTSTKSTSSTSSSSSSPESAFSFNISFKSFPEPLLRFAQLSIANQSGGNLYFIPPMIIFFVLLTEVVSEKEAKLRVGMKMMGLSNAAYWASWYTHGLMWILIITGVQYLAGLACGYTFFTRSNAFSVLALFTVFGIAMMTVAFFLSTIISSIKTAQTVGYAIILVGFVFQAVLNSLNGALVDMLWLEGAASWIVAIRYVLSLYPPFSLAKAWSDISVLSSAIPSITEGRIVEGPGFHWSDMYKVRVILDTPKFFVASPPPVESYYTLMINTAIFAILAWYLDNVLPGEHGSPRPFYFLFTREYWGLRKKQNRSQTLYAYAPMNTLSLNADDYDSDVEEEQRRATQGANLNVSSSSSSAAASRWAVRLQNISKLYKKWACCKSDTDTYAVDDVSLTIEKGELFTLLGHNGAGKTTLISMLTGVFKPTSGSATIYGLDLDEDAVHSLIGVCPQHDVLWQELTAREHLLLFARVKGIPGYLIDAEVHDKLRLVGLDGDVANKQVSSFSGGMKRRLSVAVSCIGDPKLIFLDEPSSGLDPVNKRKIWRMIEGLKMQRAIVLTTHSMEEAEVLSDRLAIMAFGKIRAIGDSLHLKNKYGDGYRISMVVDAISIMATHSSPANSSSQYEPNNANIISASATAQALFNEIQSKWPDVHLVSNDSGMLLLGCPKTFQDQMPAFLDFVKGDPRVKEWGLSHSTLESVFLAVTKKHNFVYEEIDEDEDDSILNKEHQEEEQEMVQQAMAESALAKAAAAAAAAAAAEEEREETPPPTTTTLVAPTSDDEIGEEEGEEDEDDNHDDDEDYDPEMPLIHGSDQNIAINNDSRGKSTRKGIGRKRPAGREKFSASKRRQQPQSKPQKRQTRNQIESNQNQLKSFPMRALIRKNLTLQWRQRFSTCCQILTPLLIILILVILKVVIKSQLGDTAAPHLIPGLPITQHLDANLGAHMHGTACQLFFAYSENQAAGISAGTLTANGTRSGFLGHIPQYTCLSSVDIDPTTSNTPDPYQNNNNPQNQLNNDNSYHQQYNDKLLQIKNRVPFFNKYPDETTIQRQIFDNFTLFNSIPIKQVTKYPYVLQVPDAYAVFNEIDPDHYRLSMTLSVNENPVSQYHRANNFTKLKYSPKGFLKDPTNLLSRALVIQNGYLNLFTMLARSFTSWTLSLRGIDTIPTSQIFNTIVTQPMPQWTEDNIWAFLELAGTLLYPIGLTLQIPLYLYLLTLEKSEKLREMMLSHGLKTRYYHIVNYIFFYTIYAIAAAIFWIAGIATHSRFFSQTHWSILLLFFLGWGFSLVSIACFVSAFLNSPRVATVAGYVIALFGTNLATIVCVGIYGFTPFSIKTSFPYWTFIWPQFSFSRGMYLLNDACALQGLCYGPITHITWDDPFSKSLLALYLAGIGYYILFLYLDAVLPREYGIPKHPLFFLPWFGSPDAQASKLSSSRAPMLTLNRDYPSSAASIAYMDLPDYGSDIDDTEAVVVPLKSTRSSEQAAARIMKTRVVTNEDVYSEYSRVVSGSYSDQAPLVCQGIRKVYGGSGKVAVHGLYLAVEENECFGLLGENGAGKSTTLSMLTGMFQPTEGTALVGGYDIRTQIDQVHLSMGLCPQFDLLWSDLSVREHLLFYARLKGIDSSEEDAHIDQLIKEVGLTKAANKHSSTLSGGMRRRLSIAISLVGSSKIVFLDEPTTGLDAASRRQIWSIIRRAKKGRAIILTTHSMDEAELLCNRIGILAHGKLRCIGNQQHLKSLFGEGIRLKLNYITQRPPSLTSSTHLSDTEGEDSMLSTNLDSASASAITASPSVHTASPDASRSVSTSSSPSDSYPSSNSPSPPSSFSPKSFKSPPTSTKTSVINFINTHFPSATIAGDYHGTIEFLLGLEAPLSEIFRIMESQAPRDCISDWAVSQIGLEDVFQTVVAQAEIDNEVGEDQSTTLSLQDTRGYPTKDEMV